MRKSLKLADGRRQSVSSPCQLKAPKKHCQGWTSSSRQSFYSFRTAVSPKIDGKEWEKKVGGSSVVLESGWPFLKLSSSTVLRVDNNKVWARQRLYQCSSGDKLVSRTKRFLPLLTAALSTRNAAPSTSVHRIAGQNRRVKARVKVTSVKGYLFGLFNHLPWAAARCTVAVVLAVDISTTHTDRLASLNSFDLFASTAQQECSTRKTTTQPALARLQTPTHHANLPEVTLGGCQDGGS